jgi:hypothetical protein
MVTLMLLKRPDTNTQQIVVPTNPQRLEYLVRLCLRISDEFWIFVVTPYLRGDMTGSEVAEKVASDSNMVVVSKATTRLIR